MNDDERLIAAIERLELRRGHARLELSFTDLTVVISQVQLALRHPANVGVSSFRVRAFLEQVIGTLELDEPDLGPLLRMGFDPQHDVSPAAAGPLPAKEVRGPQGVDREG